MDLTRRDALQQVMLAGAGLALVPELGWPAAWQLDAGRVLVPFDDIPENFATRRPPGEVKLPGQDALGIDLRNVTAKTPVNDTFIVSHYNTPVIDAAQWRLSIQGNAGRPMQLTLDELKRRPRTEVTATFECGGNREAIDPPPYAEHLHLGRRQPEEPARRCPAGRRCRRRGVLGRGPRRGDDS